MNLVRSSAVAAAGAPRRNEFPEQVDNLENAKRLRGEMS